MRSRSCVHAVQDRIDHAPCPLHLVEADEVGLIPADDVERSTFTFSSRNHRARVPVGLGFSWFRN